MLALRHVAPQQDGKVLGCQACGDGEGVDKRVDVVATLLQKGGTVYDMEEAELCYGEERKGGGRARGGGGDLGTL